MYYCLYRFKMSPPQYLALTEREKAFIMAAASVFAKSLKK